MKKIIYLIVFAFFLVGCKGENIEKEAYNMELYILNTEKTKLVGVPYNLLSSNTEEKINEVINALQNNDLGQGNVSPILDDINIQKHVLKNRTLYVYFSSSYYKIPSYTEVLCRAAIVKSLVQIPEIDNVMFMVNNVVLNGVYGHPIPPMNSSSFIENIGTDINAYQSFNCILYFSDKNMDKLVKVKESITYLSSLSREKVVMDELIKGPAKGAENDVFPTMPIGLRVNSIITKNGICYIDLNDKALNIDIKPKIFIYSIVNSITELPNITKVKFSINSDDSANIKDISLKDAFEHNDSIVLD